MNEFKNMFLRKNNNTTLHSNIFKRKRPADNELNSEYFDSYKKMKLIEDFERLSLGTSNRQKQSKTNFNISINIPDQENNTEHIIYQEIKQSFRHQYQITDKNWEVAIQVNWKIFWHFIFLHNNNPKKKHIKIKNILWWITQVGIPQGLDIWNYYYFDSYEKRAKRYYKVPEDVEMEL